MSDTTTRVLTAHVPLPLAEKVDELAARLDRSRGWIIKQALAAWVRQQNEAGDLRPVVPVDVNRHAAPDQQSL